MSRLTQSCQRLTGHTSHQRNSLDAISTTRKQKVFAQLHPTLMLLQTNQVNSRLLLPLDQFPLLLRPINQPSNNTPVVFLLVALVVPNLIMVSLPSDGELMPLLETTSSSRIHGDQAGVIMDISRSVLAKEL